MAEQKHTQDPLDMEEALSTSEDGKIKNATSTTSTKEKSLELLQQ